VSIEREVTAGEGCHRHEECKWHREAPHRVEELADECSACVCVVDLGQRCDAHGRLGQCLSRRDVIAHAREPLLEPIDADRLLVILVVVKERPNTCLRGSVIGDRARFR
jgi:hypothetical protein